VQQLKNLLIFTGPIQCGWLNRPVRIEGNTNVEGVVYAPFVLPQFKPHAPPMMADFGACFRCFRAVAHWSEATPEYPTI
jgi:hypothetical protein